MSLIENRLKKVITDFFSEYLPDGRNRLLIGFSGGADSLCLARLLCKYKSEFEVDPALAYLDHGIRSDEERQIERDFAVSTSRELGVSLYSHSIKAGELEKRACEEGKSLEDSAREARYGFFDRVLEREGYDFIALGHHRDDNMETLIMRFFQGAGPSGLGGIKPVRGKYIRPFLSIPKKDITGCLQEQGRDWLTDSTNRKNIYLRNGIRNRIVPVVTDVFPGYPGALENLSRRNTEISEFIDNETLRRLRWKKEPAESTYSIESGTFFGEARLLVINSLYGLYNLTFPEKKTDTREIL